MIGPYFFYSPNTVSRRYRGFTQKMQNNLRVSARSAGNTKILPKYAVMKIIKRIYCFAALLITITANSQTRYPDNIYPDTTYAPFYYGVASGDPLQDKVIIWTKV